MRARGALWASAALALGLGCAHDAALSPLPSVELAPLAEPEARLVLVGDAGVLPSEPSVLDETRAWIEAHAAPTTVAFLGDNFYPTRADDRAAAVLSHQSGVSAAPESVLFVPGNHDWHDRGFRVASRMDRTRIDALASIAGSGWKPAPGELGPEIVEPSHRLFRVLAIDSERWRIAAGACVRAPARCAPLRAAEERLAAALACGDCAPAVVVAHHPPRSAGEHGGCGISALRKALNVGGQDLLAPAYQAYIASLTRALAPRRPLLFAAGHDHSLQLIRDDALGVLVVSGSGAHRSAVCGPADSSWSRNGFVSVDFARAAPPLLRIFARADDGSLRELRREALAP